MVRNRLATEMEEAKRKGGGIRPGAHPEFEGGPKARKPKPPRSAVKTSGIESQIAARKEENAAIRRRKKFDRDYPGG